MSGTRIAVVAPPWYPVPPAGYGGIELVVHLLVGEMRRRGIDVTLYASEGSAHDAVALAPAEWQSALGHRLETKREVAYLGRVVEHMGGRGYDLVHDHTGGVGALVAGMLPAPSLHTVHFDLDEPNTTMYREAGKHIGLVAISDAQRRSQPDLNWTGVVHNAVDVDSLEVARPDQKEEYLFLLARISPEKGQHHAIEVARRTGRHLILAGKVGEKPCERQYWEQRVKPAVEAGDVTYYENVAGPQKARLLSRARALLFPIEWEEPFGLALIEAAASGTPALAFGRGAVPELIEQGVTGLLCESVDDMVAAVEAAGDISPETCAEAARSRFSPAVMTDRYLRMYEAVVTPPRDVAVLGRRARPSVAPTSEGEPSAIAG